MTGELFEDVVGRIEGRRNDLRDRQNLLRSKITIMERSIPALMAFNLWSNGASCKESPYCRIREIMRQIAPNCDPTEKLLGELKENVKKLNVETSELHDKIIDADVKLEGDKLEIESLTQVIKEIDEKTNNLKSKVNQCDGSCSVSSLDSDDVICLTKIRTLGNEELELKRCIKELEKREMLIHDQVCRLLGSGESQLDRGHQTRKQSDKMSIQHTKSVGKEYSCNCNHSEISRKSKSRGGKSKTGRGTSNESNRVGAKPTGFSCPCTSNSKTRSRMMTSRPNNLLCDSQSTSDVHRRKWKISHAKGAHDAIYQRSPERTERRVRNSRKVKCKCHSPIAGTIRRSHAPRDFQSHADSDASDEFCDCCSCIDCDLP